MKHLGRKLAVPAVGLVIAGGGFAFLASNSFAGPDAAGSGEQSIAGYTVSDVTYTIDTGHIGDYSENSANIATVSFVLDKAATTANVSADIVGSYQGQVAKYGHCSQTTGFTDSEHFTCGPDGSEANLGNAVKLVVNAAQ